MSIHDDEIVTGENGHTYPSKYPPGSHWAVDAGWEILDAIKPGVIPNDVRFFLAGQIAGRLMKEREQENHHDRQTSPVDGL